MRIWPGGDRKVKELDRGKERLKLAQDDWRGTLE